MSRLSQQIEAVLFVASEPVTMTVLSQATAAAPAKIAAALEELAAELEGRGLQLIKTGHRYELATSPEVAPAVERYLGNLSRSELSKPALETLAIIAYRQPVTKSQIETIRGVSSEQTLRNLLQRGLIIENGQADAPGRPTLYATSSQFLLHFGLASHEELPPIDDTHED